MGLSDSQEARVRRLRDKPPQNAERVLHHDAPPAWVDRSRRMERTGSNARIPATFGGDSSSHNSCTVVKVPSFSKADTCERSPLGKRSSGPGHGPGATGSMGIGGRFSRLGGLCFGMTPGRSALTEPVGDSPAPSGIRFRTRERGRGPDTSEAVPKASTTPSSTDWSRASAPAQVNGLNASFASLTDVAFLSDPGSGDPFRK
jgi:hypothetical protein